MSRFRGVCAGGDRFGLLRIFFPISVPSRFADFGFVVRVACSSVAVWFAIEVGFGVGFLIRRARRSRPGSF